MKTVFTAAALVSALALPFGASAQQQVINFTGTIVASACAVSQASADGGQASTASTTSPTTINVALGTWTSADIVNLQAVNSRISAGTPLSGPKINFNFKCGTLPKASDGTTNATTFTVQFAPTGTLAGGVLPVTGGATGVGIALVSEGKVVNLSNPQPAVKGKLTPDASGGSATGTLDLQAMYVATGTTIGTGGANATLPFTLIYN